MSIPPTSQLVIGIAQGPFMQWYLDALYLNHGYSFFAPDPGPGRLVYYDIYDRQGTVIRQGKFPDWDMQWPRLWYHRHFMLADQVGIGLQRDDGPGEGERKYLEAYARQLLRQYPGESVRVRWIAHLLPMLRDPNRFSPSDPVTLDAPASYTELMPPVVQRRSDLASDAAEAVDQSTNTHSGHPNVADRWMRATR
jgi:hypothetical protein